MTPRHRWVEWFFFLVALAILFFFSRQQLFYDPGSFWHTVTGDLLRQDGLIYRDPFTYTQEGREWIPHQWLGEILMSLAHERMGLDGLLWLTILLLASLFGWMAGRFSRQGFHPLFIALLLALGYGAMCYHFHARPHLATMLLLGASFAVLIDVEAERQRLGWLWLLAPLFALWVNLHGGVLGGMATFGLAGIGWGAFWLIGWPGPLKSGRDVFMLAFIGLISAATVFFNPYGLDLLRMWQEILRQDLPTIITEHRPLDWTEPEGIMVLCMGGLHLFFLLGVRGQKPRITWLLPIVWFILAILRIRNGPLFAVTAMLAWADLLPHTLWMRWLARRSDLILIPDVPPPPGTPPWEPAKQGWRGWFLQRSWLLLWPLPWLMPGLLMGYLHLDREHWPLDLLEPLRKECAQPQSVIFNEDLYGGFLIYHVRGKKIFIDDRCELHGNDLLMDYVDAFRHKDRVGPWFEGWVKKYGINLALVRTTSTFGVYLHAHPDWEVVELTRGGDAQKRATLFRRKAQRPIEHVAKGWEESYPARGEAARPAND